MKAQPDPPAHTVGGACQPPSKPGGFTPGIMWCCPTCKGLWYATEHEWKFLPGSRPTDEPNRENFSLRQLVDPQVLTITGFPPYDGQWVRYEPPCNAPLNIKGEGFNCDKGWGHALPHGNTEAGAIWDGEQPPTDSPEPTR